MAGTKRKRDRSGSVDPYAKRRARYRAVLGRLGLWESFAAMPRRVQEVVLKQKAPDPELTFDASVPAGEALDAARREVEEAFADATFETDFADGGGPMATREFFSVALGLKLLMMQVNLAGTVPAVLAFFRAAGPVVEGFFDRNLPDATAAAYSAVRDPLLAHSRMESRLLATHVRLEATASGKNHFRATVRADQPQVRRVALDGAARPVCRVPDSPDYGEPRWLSWTAAQAGRAAGAADLPVYVQSHALRNLDRRVNLPAVAPYLQAWLEDSLRHPVIVEREAGGDWLVEFRIQSRRVGYLIVTPLEDAVVVRTFKFLTMSGTPEARKIARRLKLNRRDNEWLGLDDLAAFTRTDLCDDPVLRPLLESCGCGHLFDLDEYDWLPQPKPLAAEVRRYLGMAA